MCIIDAMTGFGKIDQEIHNEEVKIATENLIKKVIPSFAATLDKLDKTQLKTLKLTELLHKEGINARHMVCMLLSSKHSTLAGHLEISCH
jgi:hypothetical protein